VPPRASEAFPRGRGSDIAHAGEIDWGSWRERGIEVRDGGRFCSGGYCKADRKIDLAGA